MNFVSRVARSSIVNLQPYVSARSLAIKGKIFLDANEAPGFFEDQMNRYPEPQPLALLESFAKIYQVKTSQILLTRGADEGIDLLLRTFCEPGQDRILIAPPTYGMYRVAADIQNVEVLAAPLKLAAQRWSLPISEICERVKNEKYQIKLVFICNPNNPTGTLFSKNEIENICESAKDSLVVIDEAYIEFSPAASSVELLSRFENLVILRTLSKAWGLAGLRCGALLASPQLIALMQKVRAPYPLPTPVIKWVERAIRSNRAMIDRVEFIKAEREKIQRFLSTMNIVEAIYDSAANFLLVRFKNFDAVMQVTRELGLVLRSRASELEGAVRITVGSSSENLFLLEALKQVKTP